MRFSNHKYLFLLLLILIILPNTEALEIDSCQTLSTNGEDYVLNQSIPSSGDCFFINESNIVLNCSGFSVTGDSAGNGVNITGDVDNVTVTDCILTNFTTGIAKEEYYSNYNITISNNVINTSALNGPGVIALQIMNSTITNNTIYTSGDNSHALRLNPGPNNTEITYNKLTTYGGNSYGMMPALSNYNNISWNVITTHGYISDAIDYPESFYNYIGNNILIVYGEGGGVDTVHNSSHNIIDNNTIFLMGDDIGALELCENATNNTLSNNMVTSYGTDNTAMEICISAHDNTMINNVFNLSTPMSIIVEGGGDNNVFINNTFDKDAFLFETPFTGSVTVQWFVNVSVLDPNGSLSSGASVYAYNGSGSLVDSATTGSSGEVQFILTEFWQNASGRVYSVPHTINVTKAPFANESREVNLSVTESTSLDFQLLEFIGSCGQTITNSSALSQNLSCDGVGVIIGNHNVTLDCKGFNITENHTQEGVRCYHWDNITVRNCEIYNAGPAAIYYFNSSYGLVEGNTVVNSSKNESGGWIGHGIVMSSGSSYNLIRNNTAINNTMTGFIPIEENSTYNIFMFNYATGHGDQGMEIENGAHHNYFLNNTIVGNYFGITLSPGTHDNTVRWNTVIDTQEAAFEVSDSSGNLMEYNYAYNASKGMNLGGTSSNNSITGNTFISAYSGITFAPNSLNITASGNTIEDCGEGIFFENATNVTVEGNTFLNNQYEVHMDANSSGIEIFNNVFIGNNLINTDGVFTWNNGSVGNRWSTFDQPSEGCEDANSNGICDSSFSMGGGNIDYFPVALVRGAVTQEDDGDGGSSSVTVTGGGSLPECTSDANCSGEQSCIDGECVNVTCECGVIVEHACMEYECCNDSACPGDMKCVDNVCIAMNETLINETLELMGLLESLLQERAGHQGIDVVTGLLEDAQEAFLNGDLELARNLSLEAIEAIENLDRDNYANAITFYILAIAIILALSVATILIIRKNKVFKRQMSG